jgi:hypothetical protein
MKDKGREREVAKGKSKASQQARFPLPPVKISRLSLIIYLVGFLVLILGFYLASMGPYTNTLSTTVSPMILLIGYLVIFPLGIFAGGLFKSKSDSDEKKDS